MKRRTFFHTSAVFSAATALAGRASAAEPAAPAREYYELRTYTLKPARKPMLDQYLSKAFIPALGRLGSGPVGVFAEEAKDDVLAMTVLIVHKSPEQFATLATRLAADAEHQSAGQEYLQAKAADPVYERVESSLSYALEGIPSLQKPEQTPGRILNLRIYESHNERAGAKKIEMFNKGELGIFRRVGLTPVFFGQTIAGARMPNLTYLLAFPNDAARLAAWKTFQGDEEWKALKSMPEYADKEIVSKITNKILVPESYSQI